MQTLLKVSLDKLDFISWGLVFGFFAVCASLFHGNVEQTIIGAGAIIILMLVISHSIELILGVLRDHPKAGELTGYITNGPEALCVAVGLLNNKLLFAAGVPLGSNFANPVLMLVAAVVTMYFFPFVRSLNWRSNTIITGTMLLAGLFYLPFVQLHLWYWVLATIVLTAVFYAIKGKEDEGAEEDIESVPPVYLVPATVMLVAAGYFLDPAVSFTALHSKVPPGAIGFFVLSFITSWPEFRSAITLLKRARMKAALMNIMVSNLTNLWLAVFAATAYLLTMP